MTLDAEAPDGGPSHDLRSATADIPIAPSRRPTPGRRGRRSIGPDGPSPDSSADQVPDADPAGVARAVVLRRLTAAPRSRAQLEEDLRRRGVPDPVADQVLDRFTEVGLVDDAAFAEGWVRSRHASRGLSRRALAHELRQKGVGDEVAAAALGGLDADDEHAAAQALVARRLSGLRSVDDAVATRRLVGLLARKGYGGGLALHVVREALPGRPRD